jgi:hypothetical protein
MSRTAAVIYLWAPDDETANSSFDQLAKRCEDYAFRFCWDVVETVRDVGGSNEFYERWTRVNAFARTGLDQVLALIHEKRAAIVLVPNARMVGATTRVYHAVCERVEKLGGFVQVVSDDTNASADTPTTEAD